MGCQIFRLLFGVLISKYCYIFHIKSKKDRKTFSKRVGLRSGPLEGRVEHSKRRGIRKRKIATHSKFQLPGKLPLDDNLKTEKAIWSQQMSVLCNHMVVVCIRRNKCIAVWLLENSSAGQIQTETKGKRPYLMTCSQALEQILERLRMSQLCGGQPIVATL